MDDLTSINAAAQERRTYRLYQFGRSVFACNPIDDFGRWDRLLGRVRIQRTRNGLVGELLRV
jgi:hypothetical protein